MTLDVEKSIYKMRWASYIGFGKRWRKEFIIHSGPKHTP
jgi:hypothetical protein